LPAIATFKLSLAEPPVPRFLEERPKMTMTGQPALSAKSAFQGMAALALDAGFFTSEFRLCDKVAEYLADLIAQSHEDPARYGNFSTSLINEAVELAFRLAQGDGKIEIILLKSDDSVCLRVEFCCGQERQALLRATDHSSGSSALEGPARDLMALASAINVAVTAEFDGDDRATMVVKFKLSEGPH
jgi:hypothetical protein